MQQQNSSGEPNRQSRPRQVIEKPETLDSYFKKKKSERSFDFTWQLLYNWPARSEVWPLVYGPFISGGAAAMTGIVSNHKFRSYVVLGSVARISSYLACAAIPFACVGATHWLFISSDIAQQKTVCPVCVHVRATGIQAVGGAVYPNLLVAVANFWVLSRMKKVMYLPDVSKDPMALLKYCKQVMMSYKGALLYSSVFQVLLAAGLTYLEQDSYYTNVAPKLDLELFQETRESNNDALSH